MDGHTLLPKYAVINADLGPGRDWVASVGLSEWFGAIVGRPEYWRLYPVEGAGGPQTIILDRNFFFFRARLSGDHLGIYVDSDGEINCLPERVFLRELDRRFGDGVGNVDLTWDGDWSHDPFSQKIRAARLGEIALCSSGWHAPASNGTVPAARPVKEHLK